MTFVETKAAGIDGGQVGMVVGGIDAGQDPADFFLAEDGRQSMFRLCAEDIENVPVMPQDVRVKESDPAIADSHGL